MRHHPRSSAGPRGGVRAPRSWGRRIVDVHWLSALAMLAGLAFPSGLLAQTAARAPSAGANDAAAGTPANADPGAKAAPARSLARFVPGDHLRFYLEFDGLDAHADAWRKTAAYRLLNETPLGAMVEEVAVQLVDQKYAATTENGMKGADVVALVKHIARNGFVVAANVEPGQLSKSPASLKLLAVLGKGTTKEIRPITSRVLGWLMGTTKAKIERKEGRQIVVVPTTEDRGWAWWDEGGDLVLSALYPSAPLAALAALDGKTKSAADHSIVQELRRREGKFEPVGMMFFDFGTVPAAAPGAKSAAAETKDGAKKAETKDGAGGAAKEAAAPPVLGDLDRAFSQFQARTGVRRVDYRWGFEDDAVVEVVRIAAPRPRKPALALFDQPGFDAKSLLPSPEGVGMFLELSIDPNQLLETIADFGPPGKIKGMIDDFAETVQTAGNVDLRKDVLAHLGPRMLFYAAPNRSAAAGSEPLSIKLGEGANVLSAIQNARDLPKLTLVAEVNNPAKFVNSLDSAIIAINSEMRMQAAEIEEEEDAAKADKEGGLGAAPDGAANQPANGRRGGKGRRGRRRSTDSVSAPKFEMKPGDSGHNRTYLLRTPTDSKLRIGPQNFRPAVQLRGKYLAVAISSDAAEQALESVQRKDWKPSAEFQRAADHLPPKMAMLAVSDPREQMPQLLASLPGTLQTIINSVAAIQNGQGRRPNGGLGGAMMGGPGADGGARRGGPGARRRAEDPNGQAEGGSGGPGAFGGAGGPGGPGSKTREGMITLKVDAGKLPKADALKALMFPHTYAVTTSDQDVRIIRRKSLLGAEEFGFWIGFAPAFQTAIQNVKAAAAARASQAAGGQQGQDRRQPGGMPGMMPGAMPGGPPGESPGGPPGEGGGPGRGGRRRDR